MTKLEMVGILSSEKYDKMHDISRRVYSPDGIAPTLHTNGGGNLEPKVIEYERDSEQGSSIYKNGTRNIVENLTNRKGV